MVQCLAGKILFLRRAFRRCRRRDRRGWLSWFGAKNALQRLLEGFLHRNLVAKGDNDPFELGQRALRGGQVERLDVEKRFLDRYGQETPADNLRSRLTPQGDLL